MSLKITGNIKKGKMTLHDRESLKDFIANNEGDVSIFIKILPKTRSAAQNNYYWTIIKSVANEIGYTEDEMHQVVKDKFKIDSTRNLEQDEFSDLIDKIIRYFAQAGFPVEDPR